VIHVDSITRGCTTAATQHWWPAGVLLLSWVLLFATGGLQQQNPSLQRQHGRLVASAINQLQIQAPLVVKYVYSYSHSPPQVDRTTMGLYYSGNAVDWWPAGVIDYHLDFAEHFTYPHMAVAGEDLLVVMRATAPPLNETATSKWCVF